MEELVQVKAEVPRMLKRRAFAALALREERFSWWLRTQLESWLQHVEAERQEKSNGTTGVQSGQDAEAQIVGAGRKRHA